MTQEIAQRVSELYKELNSFKNKLFYLQNSINLKITVDIKNEYHLNQKITYDQEHIQLSQEFREKIKKQVIELLENRIKEIDNELEKL